MLPGCADYSCLGQRRTTVLASLTTDQLTLLTAANRDRHLEASGAPATGLRAVAFETVAACQAEDRRRADALRKLKAKPWVRDCNLIGLANLLDAIAESDPTSP